MAYFTFLILLLIYSLSSSSTRIDEWASKLLNKCSCYEEIFKFTDENLQKIIVSYLSLDEYGNCLPINKTILNDYEFFKVINKTTIETEVLEYQLNDGLVKKTSLALYRLYIYLIIFR